jgi:hypothetical protein
MTLPQKTCTARGPAWIAQSPMTAATAAHGILSRSATQSGRLGIAAQRRGGPGGGGRSGAQS